MSDSDNGLEKKHQILLDKYKNLRRNHRKLAGIALRLVETLEAYVRNEAEPDVRNVLVSCMSMYPGLTPEITAEEEEEEEEEDSRVPELETVEESAAEVEKVAEQEEEEKESESSEKDYFKGFWSKPKIPRTPLV